MAKSKSGGTRSYIRGRVGADVYGIGKDSKGNKQQVVRSLAESVANPQTMAQMKTRMLMYTVSQAMKALNPIVDHSFDNVPNGQPSLSEFTSRNFALIKADAEAHPQDDNIFGCSDYQEKGVKQGSYLVSSGRARYPEGIKLFGDDHTPGFSMPEGGGTFADLKARLSLGSEDYITIVVIRTNGTAKWCRLHWNEPADLTVDVTPANILSAFTLEGTYVPTPRGATGQENEIIMMDNLLSGESEGANLGCIITKKTASGFIHNTCQLSDVIYIWKPAYYALQTWPVGSQRFLNGGDL